MPQKKIIYNVISTVLYQHNTKCTWMTEKGNYFLTWLETVFQIEDPGFQEVYFRNKEN